METGSGAASCRICGIPLQETETGAATICANCATSGAAPPSEPIGSADFGGPYSTVPPISDPDRPWWGVTSAIAMWLFSVAAIVVVPVVAASIMLILETASGNRINLADRAQFTAWVESPSVVFWSIIATAVAHLLTAAVCWAFVTRWNKRPLLETLGWSWIGPSMLWKTIFVVSVVAGMLGVFVLLGKALPPPKENVFERLLKTSFEVRLAVSALAVFTAPLVEEWIYRGILYSGLRKKIGVTPSVIIVTAMFAGVHWPQYWGNLSTIIGLTLLSLLLTGIRASTKSLMPCYFIHLLNNLVGAISIIWSQGSN